MFCHDLKPRHVDDERGVTWRASGATCDDKKGCEIVSNLGLDVVFGKRRGDKTGQITAK
jgi:hypothetical protein